MENMLCAVTNLCAYWPITNAFNNGDVCTGTILSYVATASFISHLVECHKFDMPGVGFSTRTSYILNRMDVLGCALVGFRLSYLVAQHGLTQRLALCGLGALCLNVISCHGHNSKTFYLVTHNLWHVAAFGWLHMFLGSERTV